MVFPGKREICCDVSAVGRTSRWHRQEAFEGVLLIPVEQGRDPCWLLGLSVILNAEVRHPPSTMNFSWRARPAAEDILNLGVSMIR